MGLFLFSSISTSTYGAPPVGISSEARIPTTDPIDKDTSITFQCDAKTPFGFPPITADWVRMYYKVNAGSWYYTAMTLDAYITYKVTKTSVQLGADILDTVYWYCKMKDSNLDYYTGDTFDYDTIDDEVPIISSIDHSPNEPTHIQDVTITCDVIDDSTIDKVEVRYKIEAGSWSVYSEMTNTVGDTYSYTYDEDIVTYANIDDYVYYQVRAEDEYTNEDATSGTDYWTVVGTDDEEAPVITDTGYYDDGTLNTVVLWVTGTDNVAVTHAKVNYDLYQHGSYTESGWQDMIWSSPNSRWEYTVTFTTDDYNPEHVDTPPFRITEATYKIFDAANNYDQEVDGSDIALGSNNKPFYCIVVIFQGGNYELNNIKGNVMFIFYFVDIEAGMDDVTLYLDADDDGNDDYSYTYQDLTTPVQTLAPCGFTFNATLDDWVRVWAYASNDVSHSMTTSVFRFRVMNDIAPDVTSHSMDWTASGDGNKIEDTSYDLRAYFEDLGVCGYSFMRVFVWYTQYDNGLGESGGAPHFDVATYSGTIWDGHATVTFDGDELTVGWYVATVTFRIYDTDGSYEDYEVDLRE